MKPEGDFTSSLWEAVEDICIALINHAFVNQLAKGTLPHHCFVYYLSQDILYIRDEARLIKEGLWIEEETNVLKDMYFHNLNDIR